MRVLPGALLSGALIYAFCYGLRSSIPLLEFPPRRPESAADARQRKPSQKIGAAVSAHAGKCLQRRVSVSHLLNHCENAIAASNAGVIPRSIQTPGSIRRGFCFFSGDVLSYLSLRRAQPVMNGTAWRNVLAPRRACSPHVWVARVSRLIGISDTTAKIYPWQVDVWGRDATYGGSRRTGRTPQLENYKPKRRKRHSLRSGV
jgi:hypothetical protein